VQGEYSDVRYQTAMGEPKFLACEKHDGKPGVDMLELILGEMFEKEVTDAQKTPVHMYEPPQTSSNDGALTGDSVQTVAKVNRPAAVKPREKQDPLAIKSRQRSPEELRATGALIGTPMEVQIEEVDENPDITSNIAELFEAVGGEPSEG